MQKFVAPLPNVAGVSSRMWSCSNGKRSLPGTPAMQIIGNDQSDRAETSCLRRRCT
jgi:hypothetical protein